MHQICITGGTGFIGRQLATLLTDASYQVVIATRNPDAAVAGWQQEGEAGAREQDSEAGGRGQESEAGARGQESGSVNPQTGVGSDNRQPGSSASVRFVEYGQPLEQAVAESHAVINLAGESLFGKRWTPAVKRRLYNSRIETTRSLAAIMERLPSSKRPEVFISASAVGFYGEGGANIRTEEDACGNDFLAHICRDWEQESLAVQKLGVRVVNPRIGIALGTSGGALKTMLPVFRSFVGGSIGAGAQYFPWIHVEDLGRSIMHMLASESCEGAYNASAPEPVTMDVFAAALGRVLARPAVFRVPEWALKMALGEASSMLTTSLRVVPRRLVDNGFRFTWPTVDKALEALLTDDEKTTP